MTLRDQAERLGITYARYHQLENALIDRGPIDPDVSAPKALTDLERCLLLRRRAGMQVGGLAREMGVSRSWVQMLERGEAPIERLRDFWLQRGA